MKIIKHHTKDKGDVGVAKAYCDLVEKGYIVLFPSTEHAPFDLVAYDGSKFIRIQVKYRSAVEGCLQVNLINWGQTKTALTVSRLINVRLMSSAFTARKRTGAITLK